MAGFLIRDALKNWSKTLKIHTLIIASPSPVQCANLTGILKAIKSIEIVCQCANLSETFTKAEVFEPAIVVVSVDFCRQNEWEAMKALFRALGTAWIVATPENVESEARITSTYCPDSLVLHPNLSTDEVRQRIDFAIEGFCKLQPQSRVLPIPNAPTRYEHLVLIGASTGGVDALLSLLSSFPADCPPTAIVQHTGKGFSESLIKLLDRKSKSEVVAAQTGVDLIPGRICVAAGMEGHLTLKAGKSITCEVQPGAPVSGHVPSVDMLFRSALPIASKVIGVILTGMGRDGAQGLLELRGNGAQTLGQDAASSVVYGMPKVAWELGAVEQQLPILRMGDEIMRICRAGKRAFPGSRLAVR